MFVKEIVPRIIKNSRGEKTIEVRLRTYEGKFFSSAPSGKSRGKREVEPYNIRGIDWSFKLLRAFCRILVHKNFIIKRVDDLSSLELLLRKFEARFGKLGGNVWYVLETVFLKAAAADKGIELWQLINNDLNNGKKPKIPMPVGNCIGGGLHSLGVKGKKPDFQEFLLIPKEKSISRAVTLNLRAYTRAASLLRAKKRNDENAWETNRTNEETLSVLKKVADEFGLRVGLDVAASTFFKKGYYHYKNKRLIRDRLDQIDFISVLKKKFGLFYIEDPLQEDDFSGFKELLARSGKSALVVGDDLTTTNPKSVERAIRSKCINAVIVKPNQIGSIIEVKKVVIICKKNKIKMIFSHRSGETKDDALADYCIGFGGDFIKSGIYGKERLIKLRRLIEIEKKINAE